MDITPAERIRRKRERNRVFMAKWRQQYHDVAIARDRRYYRLHRDELTSKLREARRARATPEFKKKECVRQKTMRHAMKKHFRAYAKSRYWADVEMQRAKNRKYYWANHTKKLAQSRAYAEANRAELNTYSRAWAATHKTRSLAMKRAWTLAHPHECRQVKAKRRARMAGCGVSRADYREIIATWNGLCGICAAPVEGRYEFDHIVPLAKGGAHTQSNIQVTHQSCNRRKGSKLAA